MFLELGYSLESLGSFNNTEAWNSFPEFVLIDSKFDLGIRRFKNSPGGSNVQSSLRTIVLTLLNEIT